MQNRWRVDMRFTKSMLKTIGNAEWMDALHDGRVVRFNDGMEFRSFRTANEAEIFRLTLRRQDIDAVRLQVPGGTPLDTR
jgi:hypothetical protein